MFTPMATMMSNAIFRNVASFQTCWWCENVTARNVIGDFWTHESDQRASMKSETTWPGGGRAVHPWVHQLSSCFKPIAQIVILFVQIRQAWEECIASCSCADAPALNGAGCCVAACTAAALAFLAFPFSRFLPMLDSAAEARSTREWAPMTTMKEKKLKWNN